MCPPGSCFNLPLRERQKKKKKHGGTRGSPPTQEEAAILTTPQHHLEDLKRRHETVSSWKVGWRLTSFLRPYWKIVLAAWAINALGMAMMFVPADVIGRVGNDLKLGDFSHLWLYAAIIVGNELLRFAISYPRAILDVRATGRAEWDLQVKLYDVLQHTSLSFHDRESSGQLISRMITDMRFVGSFFRMVLSQFVEIGLVFTIGIAYLFWKNWLLALCSLAAMPVAAFVVVRFASRVRLKFYDVRQQHGAVTGVLSENISGVRVVRGFAREREQIDRFSREGEKLIDKEVDAAKMWAFNEPLFGVFVTMSMALTFFVGGSLVMNAPDDKAIFGTVLSFFMALRILTMRLGWMGHAVGHAQRAVASADRIFEVLDEVPDIHDRKGAAPLAEGPGRVVFEHVTFGYDPAKPVLRDLDLAVEPGQMVALVGRTGSGKTTLVSLLPRFYDVTDGRILIDGQDVRDVTLNSLRSDIGLVFQDSFLFSRTVAENIAYASPKADMETIRRTSEAAKADEFVKELPDGYDTIVGERGVTLSGGQRQRLTIARALLKDPRILILDDSTSSVDATTEREIHEAMMHLAKYRTTFVIAHRLSTVRRADLIVVLDEGRIAEKGTHDELLVKGGLYRTICELQLDKDLPSPSGGGPG